MGKQKQKQKTWKTVSLIHNESNDLLSSPVPWMLTSQGLSIVVVGWIVSSQKWYVESQPQEPQNVTPLERILREVTMFKLRQ